MSIPRNWVIDGPNWFTVLINISLIHSGLIVTFSLHQCPSRKTSSVTEGAASGPAERGRGEEPSRGSAQVHGQRDGRHFRRGQEDWIQDEIGQGESHYLFLFIYFPKGDPSGSSQPLVDIKIKVVFQ